MEMVVEEMQCNGFYGRLMECADGYEDFYSLWLIPYVGDEPG